MRLLLYSGWRRAGESPTAFVDRVHGLLARAEGAGAPVQLDGLQLDPHLREPAYEELVRAGRHHGLPAVAVRAYSPIPQVLSTRHQGSTAVFDPAATDPEEGRMAVREGRRTIELAASHGASRVILDLGRVGGGLSDEQQAQLWRLLGRGRLGGPEPDQGERLAERWRHERDARAGRHLDRLRYTLGAWLDEASRRGVQLALTNRARIDQIPSPTEALRLFEEFRGAPLGLELDLGRAYLCESTGGPRFSEWLELVAPGKLDGITVHDACANLSRLAPGTGDLALGRLLQQLATLLKPPAPAPAPAAAGDAPPTAPGAGLQAPTPDEVRRLGRASASVPLTLMLAPQVTPAELLTAARLVRQLWET